MRLRCYLCAIWPHVGPTILRDVKPRLPPDPRHPPKPARAPVRLHALSWFEGPIFKKGSLSPAGRRNLGSARCYRKGNWSGTLVENNISQLRQDKHDSGMGLRLSVRQRLPTMWNSARPASHFARNIKTHHVVFIKRKQPRTCFLHNPQERHRVIKYLWRTHP